MTFAIWSTNIFISIFKANIYSIKVLACNFNASISNFFLSINFTLLVVNKGLVVI